MPSIECSPGLRRRRRRDRCRPCPRHAGDWHEPTIRAGGRYTGTWLQNTDPAKAWNRAQRRCLRSAGVLGRLHVYWNDDQLDWLARTCDGIARIYLDGDARAGDRYVLAGRSQRHYLHGDQPRGWLTHHSDRGDWNAQSRSRQGIRYTSMPSMCGRDSRRPGFVRCLHHAWRRNVGAGKRRQGMERRIGKCRHRNSRTLTDGRCESGIHVQGNRRELDRHARASRGARRRIS